MRSTRNVIISLLTCGLAAAAQPADAQEYERGTHGTRWFESPNGGTSIKILVEASNLGSSELEIAEITFPVGASPSRPHTHTSIEIFYILEGQLDHVVDGESHVLDPGMVGIVRPEDDVIHRVLSEVPVKALVIWAPGGEADRIARFFQERPIGRRP